MKVTFHGVRGSFPCVTPSNRRYGGNTAAVSLEVAGEPLLLLDLGTGLPLLDGAAGRADQGGGFEATALLTHLHFDHVQGLPFFPPVLEAGTVLDVYGPHQPGGSLRQAVAGLIGPPYFPVPLDELPADLRFHEVLDETFEVGRAVVTVRPVPHLGPTVGYRVQWDGATLAYVSDHQAPLDLDQVDDAVLELCDGVDLLIHEAQYTPEEFREKPDWGHCTVDYAVLVAQKAGARRLCLFHHDPWRSDDDLDALVAAAGRECVGTSVVEVTAAAEGSTLIL
jgi:phosphoribosyl 1,2-cyclic phosphodiesterase